MAYPYSTSAWRKLPRNGDCELRSLLGGECRGVLGLHHLTPISEGGAPLTDELVLCCASHHRRLHAARERAEPKPKRCPHRHVYDGARLACERRLNAQAA